MPINKCRVCNNEFFKEPLLCYDNMPQASQFLPDKNALESDKGVDLTVCQCSGCGLVQLSNDQVSYYREVIRAADISQEMKDFRKKQFADFIGKFSLGNRKIIEIGCGRGEFLSIMQQFGASAYGVEYSQDSVKQCVKNGLKVSKGFIENSAYWLEQAPFDAFFILNFLEHLPEPNTILRGIYNNLAEEAIGLIEVPNFDMIMRNKLFSEFTSDHLLYFTKDTLNTSLVRNGFEIIDYKEVWYDYIISVVVQKRRKLDISSFYKSQEQLKNNINQYVSRFKNKKIAIWGAGHQALAVISLMNLADKIRYVVDSAVFKQDKFTPATHVPIVSPDKLNSDPVDAVIIMAASYSDEVASIIRKDFDRNINVAILRDFGLEAV
jgi:2-polyprenyl-3-methyl-5-hydroxy-6-metoxy-1,4-benzoquinol methylase